MKSQSPPQSGKLGDLVASRNHYGYYLRRRPSVPFKPTAARHLSQQHLRLAMAAWEALPDPTRLAWDRLARSRKAKSTFGHSRSLTGQALFIKLNTAQAALGLPPLLEPPPRPLFDFCPIGPFTITGSGRRLRLQLALPSPPAALIRVSASPPCNAARSRYWDFRLLGLLPPPVHGQSDITALYVARYGPPPPGKRIFLEVRQYENGWHDLPQRTSALVPPRPNGEIHRK